MKPLYEITSEFTSLNDFLENVDKEDVDEESTNALLNKLNCEISVKSEAIASVVKNLEHYEEGLIQIKKNLESRIKAANKKTEWLKSYLLSNMQQCGISSITGDLLSIKVKNNRQSVDNFSLALIPAKYKKATLTIKVLGGIDSEIYHKISSVLENYSYHYEWEESFDKNLEYQDMSNGIDIDGARLVTTQRVEIK